MEETLRDPVVVLGRRVIVMAMGGIIRIAVERIRCNVVFEECLQVLLAVLGEEEGIDPAKVSVFCVLSHESVLSVLCYLLRA